LEGCNEEIGDLCCIAFKPVKKRWNIRHNRINRKCGSLKTQWEFQPW
jgi:hypothetical protein